MKILRCAQDDMKILRVAQDDRGAQDDRITG